LQLVTVAWSLQDNGNNPPAQESGVQQPVDQVLFSNFHNELESQKCQMYKTNRSTVLNFSELLSLASGLLLLFLLLLLL
jgi:hypothetical protein